MRRKGKYTKHSVINRAKFFLKARWRAWKKLSTKKKALIIAGPIAGFLIITPLATYLFYYNDIGDIDRLLNRNNTGIVLYDKDDEVIYSFGKAEHRELVPLDKIPDYTEQALIAAEDKDFYEHGGFSITGYGRALVSMVTSGSIQGGGSTLTLQLAKNTLLSEQQTFLRKYQELTIAVAIEQRYSKDEILNMYLNSVYYGEGAFGIESASELYFDKSPEDLDLAESALLIGILPAPNAYSPINGDEEKAKQRQTYVLTRMVDEGYITSAEKDRALDQKLTYARQSTIEGEAPHFVEMVLNELYDKYGEEVVTRSGYQVKTTLDLDLQESANQAVENGIAHIEAYGGSNTSVVAIDPDSGGVRALVGSIDYDNEDFGKVNMATTARQPGSSFKPLYYADALARGVITPTTVIEDKPTDFGGYKPQNASRTFNGNVTVRQALDWSLNIPAVKVLELNGGPDRAVEVAKSFGITTIDESVNYGLPIALGSAEVPLTEMTNAYAALANDGTRNTLKIIDSIRDKYNKTIFATTSERDQAISSQGAYLVSNILSDNATRSRIFGASLNVVGVDGQTKTVAVKTGTTDDARDAWTIGYTPDIAVGVWVGNNDNKAMLSGGADMAGPIWQQTIRAAIGTASPSFTQPDGVVKRAVCTNGGNRLTDVFLVSNAPDECAKEEVKQCEIDGKESLKADDPKCIAEEKCEIDGKETLDADDPDCKEEEIVDTDGDGVADDDDQCPATAPGAIIDANGCSEDQLPDDDDDDDTVPGVPVTSP